MIFRFENFAESKLLRRLTPAATIAHVDPLDADRFPLLLPGQTFAVVLEDGKQDPEIVYVSANPVDGSFDLERGREGTAAKEWPIGTLFVHTLTRDSIDYFTSGGSASWFDQFNNGLIEANARIDQTNTAFADADEALAQTQLTLSASFEESSALLQETRTAFSDLTTANTSYQLAMSVRMDGLDASFSTLTNLVVSEGQATATQLTEFDLRVGEAEAGLTEEITLRAQADSSQVAVSNQIRADLDDASAQITSLNSVFSDQYGALALSFSELSVSFGDFQSSASEQFMALVDEDTALSVYQINLSASLDTTNDNVTDLSVDLSTLDGTVTALSGTVSIIGSTYVTKSRVESYLMLGVNADGNAASMRLLAAGGDSTVSQINFEADYTYWRSGSNSAKRPMVYNAVSGLLALDQVEVDGAKILFATIGTAQIANAAITNALIGNLAVGTANIQALAVTTAQIANLAVQTAQIDALAVTTAKIDALAVTTAKIDNLAVSSAKIDNLAVTSAKIGNLAVTSAKIDNLAVQSGHIDNLAVNTIHIANAAVIDAVSAYTSGNQTIGAVGTEATIQTVTKTFTGGRVRILANVRINALGINIYGITVRVRRDGTEIYQVVCNTPRLWDGSTLQYFTDQIVPIMFDDTPSAASHTYTLTVVSTTNTPSPRIASNAYLQTAEEKK